MKATELIDKLQKLIKKHDDLNIGMEDVEFAGTFYPISKIKVHKLAQTGNYFTSDDPELGEKFFGIE